MLLPCRSQSLSSRLLSKIVLLVLYGSETWSLALREEHILRVFENRVLRGIFGPGREEVTGGRRKLHNEELHRLHFYQKFLGWSNQRRMRWAGHVARMAEMRDT
jgi:hypothetical protein